MTMQHMVLIEAGEEVISSKELQRLRECEALLWEVEASLPSGLESWIDDETLQTLRGE